MGWFVKKKNYDYNQVFEKMCLKSINFYYILNNSFEFTLISNLVGVSNLDHFCLHLWGTKKMDIMM